MNNTEVRMTLLDDGDIEIRVYVIGGYSRIFYYKSYNLGDKLEDNLLKAFRVWETLRDSKKEIKDER